MRLSRSVVSICAVVVAATALSSRTGAATNAFNLATFVEHQTATKTFAANMHQTFHWTFPRKHVESVGRIYYQAPDYLALLLTNPVVESVVVRGDDLYIQRDKGKVAHHMLTIRNGKPTQNVQFLLGFFQNGCTNFTHLFDASLVQGTNTTTITLAPKHPAQMLPLRKVTNVLGWPDLDVQAMRIGLIWESYITYDFRHAVRNQAVDPAVFAIPTRAP